MGGRLARDEPGGWMPGTDELAGICRGEMLVEFRRPARLTWDLIARETPSGIFLRIKENDRPQGIVLTPIQADALEEFLARARKIRERIGSVDG